VARFGRAKPAKYSAPRSITSAAAPVRLRDRSELEKLRHRSAVARSWQLETWRVYDNLGEISFAFNLIANYLSRVRIHAAVMVNPDEPPTEVTDGVKIETPGGETIGAEGGVDPRLAARAREFISNLNTGDGIASLLRAYGLNKLTAGECYLALLDGKWTIKSTFELMVDPGGTMRWQPSMSTESVTPQEIDRNTTVIRMWTKHPKYSADPDCSLRPVLFLCEQLIRLNRMINNSVQSRMNAGILMVADEIVQAATTPGAEDNVDDPDAPELSPFETDLHATMTQPILDDQAGAAVIPMFVTAPYQYMEHGIQHITLARDVDEHLIAYAENVLTRILNGISIPKDAITGFQNVRYSNAQQISEDLFKQAVEPLALAFVDDITGTYLRPLLEADMLAHGWDADEVKKMVVWYDPSEITTRPDRGADADAGWDRGALSDDAWRKEHGFSASDAPSEDELLTRMMLRDAQLPPNLVDWMARKLLPEYFEGAPPLVTKTQAGMLDDAATKPLSTNGHGNGHGPIGKMPAPVPRTANPANSLRDRTAPAGSQDQTVPAGGTLPPKPL
jgi:hypothetical protein